MQEKVKLWTIQPISFYEKLQEKQELFGQEEYIDEEECFERSYKWIIHEMEKRLGKKPLKNSSPIWAWYQYMNIDKRQPDLRNNGFLVKGTHGVRIEFLKPKDEILLSDFDLWINVLNYWHISDNEKEYNDFEKFMKVDSGCNYLDFNTYTPEVKTMIEESWQKVLDMNYCPEFSSFPFSKKSIQATFWKLHINEVTKVDFFKAR